MSKDDRKPVSIVAEEDDDSDETVLLMERPPSAHSREREDTEGGKPTPDARAPSPVRQALLADRLSLPAAPQAAAQKGGPNHSTAHKGPANRDPANRGPANRGPANRGPANRGPANQGAVQKNRPLPDLAGFADDDDEDDDTEFLPKDQFLGRHVELQGRLGPTDPESQTPARVRSLDGVFDPSQPSGSGGVSLVADDDDEPETAVLQPPPRRLASLPPIDVEEHDDVTLSRPIVHRATFRPSGEGNPKKVLDAAGGPPPSAWAPRGARSVIALSESDDEAAPLPPPATFEGDEETHTGDGEDASSRPSLADGASDEGSETHRDLRPPVRPIGPDSETATLAQPRATDPVTSPLHRPSVESELDEDALVVDDELPPEISAPSRSAPGSEPAVASDAADPIASDEGLKRSEKAFGRIQTEVKAVEFQTGELESIADDEPGTLIVQIPEEATVFLDGTELGQGPTAIGGLDRFATYTLRVHCPGFLPWSGMASLRGEAEASLTPELRARG